jgi:hypothetical protein
MGSVGLVYRNQDRGKLFVSVVFVCENRRWDINERNGDLLPTNFACFNVENPPGASLPINQIAKEQLPVVP